MSPLTAGPHIIIYKTAIIMKTDLKNRLLAYLNAHNDGSDEAAELIREMKIECNYADTEIASICVDDLNSMSDDLKDDLRSKLSKGADEPFTVDDCVAVAEAYADVNEDDFSENLENAIRYGRF